MRPDDFVDLSRSPTARAVARSPVAERPREEVSRRLRLVVADDDMQWNESLLFLLKDLGHEVIATARDGHEALAKVLATDPDILLLDIKMPGLDGLEVCRRLMDERPLPIVILTGHEYHRLVAEAERCGASGYLVKPVEPRQLSATLVQARLRFVDRVASRSTREMTDDWPVSDAGDTEYRVKVAPELIRVLLADRHQMLAQALAVILGADADIHLVGVHGDPDLLVPQIRRTRPDVVLVSYPLLREDDGRLASLLREHLHGARLIVLTAQQDDETVQECLRAGAVGYVLKDQAPADLIQAIKRAHAGEVLFPPEQLLSLVTSPQQRPASEPQQPSAPLAPREVEVLQTLATGISTEEAAAQLGITAHTVRTHLKNSMVKLEAHSKLEAVMAALKIGLIGLPE